MLHDKTRIAEPGACFLDVHGVSFVHRDLAWRDVLPDGRGRQRGRRPKDELAAHGPPCPPGAGPVLVKGHYRWDLIDRAEWSAPPVPVAAACHAGALPPPIRGATRHSDPSRALARAAAGGRDAPARGRAPQLGAIKCRQASLRTKSTLRSTVNVVTLLFCWGLSLIATAAPRGVARAAVMTVPAAWPCWHWRLAVASVEPMNCFAGSSSVEPSCTTSTSSFADPLQVTHEALRSSPRSCTARRRYDVLRRPLSTG